MQQEIVEAAREIIEKLFKRVGWTSNPEAEKALEKALNAYFDNSMAVTVDGESDSCYAVISRRILDSLLLGEKPSYSELGLTLNSLEMQLLLAMKEAGMADLVSRTPNFSLVLRGETKHEMQNVGENSLRRYRKIVRRELLFSEGYGKNHRRMVLVENGEVIKK